MYIHIYIYICCLPVITKIASSTWTNDVWDVH